MRKVSRARWLAVVMIPVMLLGMVPAIGHADVPVEPIVIGDFGFIPNSGEASVSKVDLETGDVLARYWTAPRLGDEIDFVGDPAPGVPNTVPPYAWRTSRIATDANGNAWVLNVGADSFLTQYPGAITNWGSYAAYTPANIAARGLVGSLVRIQGDTEGLVTTNDDHAAPLMFGTDEAVKVFPVGAAGDLPRAVAIDSDGYIWVGFYGTGVFQKYAYDEMTGALAAVGDPVMTGGAPYEAKIDKNGVLWFSSRTNANPNRSATAGIGYFDTGEADPTVGFVSLATPYSLLIDNGDEGAEPVVYATNYGTNLYRIDTGLPMPWSATAIPISGANQLRGLSFDATGKIWIASTANNAVSWYDPVAMTGGTSAPIAAGAVPVGVGLDAAGMMWAICRNDANPAGFIAQFDPANLGAGFVFAYVGFRPYAYGDFVQTVPPTFEIRGTKFLSETETGLAGWQIELYRWNDALEPPGWELVATTMTDALGAYGFAGLPAGTYKVAEVLKPGWIQTCPGETEDWVHIVQLPEGATLPDADEPLTYDFCNYPDLQCFDETVWAAEDEPGTTRFVDQGNWATYVGYSLGDGTAAEPKEYPLYAGQHNPAGTLLVFDEAGVIHVKYVIAGYSEEYKEGWCGEWSGLTEYHLQVVDEFSGFNPYRTYNRKTGYGSPIPGSFDHKLEWDKADAVSETGWIPVELENDGHVFIAAHGVAWFCGAMCEPEGELEALGYSLFDK